MDTYLAIASRREVRQYADRPVPSDVLNRILDAGRLAGSAMNRQPWRFVVVEDRRALERLAETVYAPGNVRGAAVAIAVAAPENGWGPFDSGRAVENMLLAAWNEGVGSCPNGLRDAAQAAEVLGLEGEERPLVVISLGYPAEEREAESRPAEDWSRRASRKPLDEIVRRL